MMTGHGHTVEQRRGELPLFDGVERRLVEQRDRPQDLGLLTLPFGPIVASMITMP